MITEPRLKASWSAPRHSRGAAWLIGGVFALAAAILAVVVAAAFFVFAVITAVTLTISALATRGRRAVRTAADTGVLQARRVGGHSWVAYGWDDRR